MIAAIAGAALLPQPAAPEREPLVQQAAEPPARNFTLPERDSIGKPSGALFSRQGPADAAPMREQVAVKPMAPPMPYRVAGQLVQDGALHTVLARGDAILTVREGDTLDGGYRVEAIHADRVTLVYLPLDMRQDIAAGGTVMLDAQGVAAAPAVGSAPGTAARLRWDGPARVDAGASFDVALKFTSAEPVRAAPLQLTFDPEVLEPIAVRAGGFFSDGLFSYRVYPSGSIVIGASGKGAVPSDAEFVVVRFKPLRPAATAELKVTMVSLQSPAGQAIAHEQPRAFRTVVGR
jgi:hypothetical protein